LAFTLPPGESSAFLNSRFFELFPLQAGGTLVGQPSHQVDPGGGGPLTLEELQLDFSDEFEPPTREEGGTCALCTPKRTGR